MKRNQSFLSHSVIIGLIFVSTPVAGASPESRARRATSFELEMKANVDLNLHEVKVLGESRYSAATIEMLNEKALKQLRSFVPPSESHSPNGIPHQGFAQVDVSVAEAVLNSIKLHPVVSEYSYKSYNANAEKLGGDIGFCFGRAAYIDRMFQRLGVYPGSIRKIWIVGNLKAWQFHVAAIVYTNQGWMAMDPLANNGKLSTPEQWFHEMKALDEQSGRKQARLFVSEASKFGALPGDYDRIQMGYRAVVDGRTVVPGPQNDWYRNYFLDMSTHDVESENWPLLGLTKLIPSMKNPKIGILDPEILRSTFRYQVPEEEIENPFTATSVLGTR